MALYIFSDAHLGSSDSSGESKKIAKLEALFELVESDGDRLVILGDLFDFWFEYKHVIPKEHQRVLFLLHKLRERGVAIDYVCGNHDFWMDDFFATQMDIKVHDGELNTEYVGKRLHLIHGDGLAPADRGYRFLKRILRNRMNIRLYRLLPPDMAIPLAKYVSGSSRNYTEKRDHVFQPDYQEYAFEKLRSGYDIVAIGHLHIPDEQRTADGMYFCTGDFINHFSYVKIDSNGASLHYLK